MLQMPPCLLKRSQNQLQQSVRCLSSCTWGGVVQCTRSTIKPVFSFKSPPPNLTIWKTCPFLMPLLGLNIRTPYCRCYIVQSLIFDAHCENFVLDYVHYFIYTCRGRFTWARPGGLFYVHLGLCCTKLLSSSIFFSSLTCHRGGGLYVGESWTLDCTPGLFPSGSFLPQSAFPMPCRGGHGADPNGVWPGSLRLTGFVSYDRFSLCLFCFFPPLVVAPQHHSGQRLWPSPHLRWRPRRCGGQGRAAGTKSAPSSLRRSVTPRQRVDEYFFIFWRIL